MNLMTRAFLSCKRNKMKTFALLLLLIILGSVLSATISSNLAARATTRNLKANVHTVAMIEYDWNRAWEIFEETGERVEEGVDTATLRKIGDLPYVRSFDYSLPGRMWNPSLKHYEPEVAGFSREMFFGREPGLGHEFQIKGTHNPNIIEMEEGIIELVSGRVFYPEEIDDLSNVAIVSEAFATLNNLTVGSTFSMRNIFVDYAYGGEVADIYIEENIIFEESYDLKIVGLFEVADIHRTGDAMTDWGTLNLLYNRIYTPNNFVEMSFRFLLDGIEKYAPEWWGEEIPDYEDVVFYDNLFSLKTFEYLPEFRKAVEEMIPEHFQIIDTGDSHGNAFVALDSMVQLTFRSLWFAMGATILIVTLLIMLFLRDRRREIGIYLALGERKERIIVQIIMEITVVAVIAICLALIIGNLIASNISQTMLENDLATMQEVDVWFWDPLVQMGFRNDISAEAVLESYNVSLNLRTTLSFFAISILTIALSSLIPVLHILRMNPKKIMM